MLSGNTCLFPSPAFYGSPTFPGPSTDSHLPLTQCSELSADPMCRVTQRGEGRGEPAETGVPPLPAFEAAPAPGPDIAGC